MKANFIDRIKSTLIDSVIIIILLFIASYILDALHIESIFIKGLLFLLIWLYEPIFTSINQTVGQRIINLHVIQHSKEDIAKNTQNSINIFQSIMRYLVKMLLGWVSLLTIHLNDDGLALHDYVSKTKMITTFN